MAQASSSYSGSSKNGDPRSTGTQFGEKAQEFADKAGQQIDRVVAGAEETARSVAERGRAAGEQVQEVAGNIKTAVNKSVSDQPMATLAMAAALGFVIGALWKS